MRTWQLSRQHTCLPQLPLLTAWIIAEFWHGSTFEEGQVKVLENERAGLCQELRTIKAEIETQVSVVDTAHEEQEFMLNFDRIFEQASVAEKKFLVKLCISEIIVDKGQNTIDFFVRKIPAISPQLNGLYKNKKALKEVVSARSRPYV